ncbi:MAG TPA: hypothetical protein VM286_07215 [Candidatus Thermoplasmatota archaeon]|nr:hypothetical protein [Candidatus Thermoplasmatota archaeon]
MRIPLHNGLHVVDTISFERSHPYVGQEGFHFELGVIQDESGSLHRGPGGQALTVYDDAGRITFSGNVNGQGAQRGIENPAYELYKSPGVKGKTTTRLDFVVNSEFLAGYGVSPKNASLFLITGTGNMGDVTLTMSHTNRATVGEVWAGNSTSRMVFLDEFTTGASFQAGAGLVTQSTWEGAAEQTRPAVWAATWTSQAPVPPDIKVTPPSGRIVSLAQGFVAGAEATPGSWKIEAQLAVSETNLHRPLLMILPVSLVPPDPSASR